MIGQNKIIALAIIGLVIGGIIGATINTQQANVFTIGVIGGVAGFLAGWVWKTRGDDSGSGESSSGGDESAE